MRWKIATISILLGLSSCTDKPKQKEAAPAEDLIPDSPDNPIDTGRQLPPYTPTEELGDPDGEMDV